MTYVIPPINTEGTFIFAAPYDTILKSNIKYKVASIRELVELQNSEEKPLETIYIPVGLTEADFNDDLNTHVPIVVLVTVGGEYTYVPADRIKSMPDITGIKYQDKILAIALGSLPMDMNLDLISTTIIDDIYDILGIASTIKVVPASAEILKTTTDDAQFKALLAGRSKVNKSYRTRYHETLTLLNERDAKILALEEYIKTKLP